MKEKLENGELENSIVEVEVEDRPQSSHDGFVSGLGADEMGLNIQDVFGSLLPRKKKKKKLPVKQARKILVGRRREAH